MGGNKASLRFACFFPSHFMARKKHPPGGPDRRSGPRGDVFLPSHSWLDKKILKNRRKRSSAVENRPLGPRSWISFILTARHANLMNGFAGACLRRIRESRDLSISPKARPRESIHEWIRGGVPSEKWIDLRSGAPAIFDGRGRVPRKFIEFSGDRVSSDSFGIGGDGGKKIENLFS